METELENTVSTPQQPVQQSVRQSRKFILAAMGIIILFAAFFGGYMLAISKSSQNQDNPIPLLPKECKLNGKIYKIGESVPASDACNSCSCGEGGLIACTAMACEASNSENSQNESGGSSLLEATESVTPEPVLKYKDEEYGYQISYNTSWVFRHTYGRGGVANSDTSGTPKILSGFDLHNPSSINPKAVIVLSVFDAVNESDIDEWIKKYELNAPKNASSQLNLTSNLRIREYAYRYDSADKYMRKARYFIYNKKVYRLNFSELNEITQSTFQVVESFQP